MKVAQLDPEEGGLVLAALLDFSKHDGRARLLFNRVADAPVVILVERDD